jgi:transcriptional regulator with XRE-family HTH domain
MPERLDSLEINELIRAARALLRWEQRDLAQASGVSLPTIKRLRRSSGHIGCAQLDRDGTQTRPPRSAR